MKTLFIINDPPYGTERLYNGLRLAHALIKHDHEVIVFLMADAVVSAKSGQRRLRPTLPMGRWWQVF